MTPDADRLAKLLRLACSTGPDGEKLAAVNRIAALAASHNLDWDQVLANGGGAQLTEDQMHRLYDAGYQRGLADGQRMTRPQQPDWSPVQERPRSYEHLAAVLAAAGRAMVRGDLNDFEEEFIQSVGSRRRIYGSRTFVSPKQWAVLDRLADKLERRGYDLHAGRWS